jgi:hypothetical protein
VRDPDIIGNMLAGDDANMNRMFGMQNGYLSKREIPSISSLSRKGCKVNVFSTVSMQVYLLPEG